MLTTLKSLPEQSPVCSLTSLAGRLLWRPVSVAAVACLFNEFALYGRFKELTTTYLPEKAGEIFEAPYQKRPEKFAEAFSEKYFPLIDMCYEEDMAYSQLLGEMPIATYGYDAEAMDPDNTNLEYNCLLALVENSYNDETLHLDWLKSQTFAADGPSEVDLARVHPRRGEELHKILDGTKYAFMAEFADWVWWDTGNALLDYWDEGQANFPGWCEEEITGGAASFVECKEFWKREDAFLTWLKEDLRAHFHELVTFIEDKLAPVPKTNQLALWEGPKYQQQEVA